MTGKRGPRSKETIVLKIQTPFERGCVPSYAFRALTYILVHEHGQKNLQRVGQLMENKGECTAEEFVELHNSQQEIPFETYDGLVTLLAQACKYPEDNLPPVDCLAKPERYSEIGRYAPGQLIDTAAREGVITGLLDRKVMVWYCTGRIAELNNIHTKDYLFRKR